MFLRAEACWLDLARGASRHPLQVDLSATL
jgi:hypothetical protein